MSYDLDINGNHSTRHRKFIQKVNLYNVRGDDNAEEVSRDDSVNTSGARGGGEAGGTEHGADRRVMLREPGRAGLRQPTRRSPKLQCRAGTGLGR